MLTPLIAGNWKMNTGVHQGAELVIKLRELIKGVDTADVVIAPPFTSIYHLSHLIADSTIQLAGQNLHWEKSGAYTGEVSAEMLLDAGCRYVIIGHSERRTYFHETGDVVNKKLVAAIRAGLRPIVCVGETLKEREAKKTLSVVSTQLKGALAGLSGGGLKDITVAYEPIWAIGTGAVAAPQDAEEVHNALRELLYETLGAEAARPIRIIYGGSVKADNIDSLMSQPNIDGALVGGASLKAEEFARIVRFR
ncbi:MAG: triose-phosphate isomerase [Deltaproteobacteria bacterium]|nr:triose-phosphate isomerase [Deltaproteobacteria bacterium]